MSSADFQKRKRRMAEIHATDPRLRSTTERALMRAARLQLLTALVVTVVVGAFSAGVLML